MPYQTHDQGGQARIQPGAHPQGKEGTGRIHAPQFDQVFFRADQGLGPGPCRLGGEALQISRAEGMVIRKGPKSFKLQTAPLEGGMEMGRPGNGAEPVKREVPGLFQVYVLWLLSKYPFACAPP
jgi:hypothetical protein